MSRGVQDQKDKGRMFRRHGILGHYNLAGDKTDSTTMAAAMRSTLDVSELTTDKLMLATTGCIHERPGNCVVAIAGFPRLPQGELAATAASAGCAAAVAQGYATHGAAIFAQIEGAFSCAILDLPEQKLYVGVDRAGQQALHYYANADGLAFGSDAAAALCCAGCDAALQEQGVYNYVYFHMVPAPGTVYNGLKKLPAAHYIEYSAEGSTLVNYWLPHFTESTSGSDFSALAAELRTTLKQAVGRALPAQGRYGAFLSGGLDSSTVTGMLSEMAEGQTQAYAIGFSAEGYDEMAYARITARHFGVNLNEYYVTPEDVVEALPLVATCYDEPFGNSSALPAYFCARMAASDGVDTLLAGDGGDELFAGNERYTKQNVFELYGKVPALLRGGLIEPLLHVLPKTLPLVSKANSYIEQANTSLPDRLQSYNFLHRHAAAEIFSADFLDAIDTDEALQLQREIYHRPDGAGDLNRMLYLDWQITLADNDLRKVGHMCAMAGVDVTFPMLDDALLELSCRVPPQWKIKGSDLRHFFKESLRGWLPDETLSKSKQGFGLPFGVWMKSYQPLREMAYDNLARLKQRGMIRPDFIDRAIQMHQSEHAAYYGELVWILSVFELWMSGRGERLDSLLR